MLSKCSIRSGTNKTVHLLSRAMCSELLAQHSQAAGVQPQLTHSQHKALQQHRSTRDSVLPFLQRWKISKWAIESAFHTPQKWARSTVTGFEIFILWLTGESILVKAQRDKSLCVL